MSKSLHLSAVENSDIMLSGSWCSKLSVNLLALSCLFPVPLNSAKDLKARFGLCVFRLASLLFVVIAADYLFILCYCCGASGSHHNDQRNIQGQCEQVSQK